MADWDRTDYDRLEQDSRWRIVVISRDPLQGVSPLLLTALCVVLAVLTVVR